MGVSCHFPKRQRPRRGDRRRGGRAVIARASHGALPARDGPGDGPGDSDGPKPDIRPRRGRRPRASLPGLPPTACPRPAHGLPPASWLLACTRVLAPLSGCGVSDPATPAPPGRQQPPGQLVIVSHPGAPAGATPELAAAVRGPALPTGGLGRGGGGRCGRREGRRGHQPALPPACCCCRLLPTAANLLPTCCLLPAACCLLLPPTKQPTRGTDAGGRPACCPRTSTPRGTAPRAAAPRGTTKPRNHETTTNPRGATAGGHSEPRPKSQVPGPRVRAASGRSTGWSRRLEIRARRPRGHASLYCVVPRLAAALSDPPGRAPRRTLAKAEPPSPRRAFCPFRPGSDLSCRSSTSPHMAPSCSIRPASHPCGRFSRQIAVANQRRGFGVASEYSMHKCRLLSSPAAAGSRRLPRRVLTGPMRASPQTPPENTARAKITVLLRQPLPAAGGALACAATTRPFLRVRTDRRSSGLFRPRSLPIPDALRQRCDSVQRLGPCPPGCPPFPRETLVNPSQPRDGEAEERLRCVAPIYGDVCRSLMSTGPSGV